MSVLKRTLTWVTLLAGIWGNTGVLWAQKTSPVFQWITRAHIAAIYNDNLVIGTESRTPLPPLDDRYLNYTVDVGFRLALPFSQYLTAMYSYNKEDEQQVTFLQRVDQVFYGEWWGQLGRFLRYQVVARYQSFDFVELSELNFNQFSLKGYTVWQIPNGMQIHLDVSREQKRFVRPSDNVTGYSLVDASENRFNMRWRKWVTHHWQIDFRLLVGAIVYAPTKSVFLNNLSGLSPVQQRKDKRLILHPRIGRLLWNDALYLSGGIQVEQNNSNSDYYDFSGVQVTGDVAWSLTTHHFLAVEGAYGVYRYPRRRFDSRYRNTKEDFRLSFAVTYQWEITAYLELELNYQLLQNNSNDSIDYNPFTTLTYSTFQQNVFKATVHVDLGRFLFNAD